MVGSQFNLSREYLLFNNSSSLCPTQLPSRSAFLIILKAEYILLSGG